VKKKGKKGEEKGRDEAGPKRGKDGRRGAKERGKSLKR